MNRIKTDVCIIGAGSGGLSIAAGASQMGAKVVLLEGHKMGGDCLNFGCVPSKALIAAGKQAYTMGHPGDLGIKAVDAEIDFSAAKDHVHNVIATIAPVDSQERFEGFGVNVIREFGKFISKTEVQAGDTIIEARRFIIATGSGPFVPPIPGLGSKVTVIEGAKAMGKDDPEVAAVVLDKLRAEGLEIIEGALAEKISGSAGNITVQTPKGDFTGTHLLMAVGRKVNVENLDLDKADVKWDRRGVEVGANLRSVTNKKVYAVGDAAGGLQFTHVAGYHAGVVIRSMLFGLPSKQRTDHIPWATYTDPELAQVGLTEAQATEKFGGQLEVVRFPYHENDRALAEGKTTGLIKVMVVKGKPVGASIAGHLAGELIGMWAMAIANKMKMSAIAATVLPYPTVAEINKRAAGAYFTPRLFESDMVKRVVGFVQRWMP